MKRRSLVLAALAFPFLSQAQIAFGGEPLGFHRNDLPEPPTTLLPAVDVPALIQEDEARLASGLKGPFRFGFTHATDLSTANSGRWTTLDNGDRVWRIALTCPGAVSVNFVFTNYVVPEGGQVFVYNDAGHVLGAFTAASHPGHTVLGVAPIEGEHITIEYIEPASLAGIGSLTIGQVTHGYRDPFNAERGYGASGACNNNTICPEADLWRAQIRSVARIINGGDWCTGQLINNCANDGTPYFLTARHCTEGVNNFGSWVFVFKWESPVCTPTQNASANNTVSGSDLLVSNAASDVALLLLDDDVPASYNPFWTGWDRGTTAPQSGTCIHHPSGDIKKISFDDDSPGSATINLGGGNAQCWRVFTWEDGTTEGGSSGSGLWNQDGRLVGQLYGGQASCSNNVNDYFGKFSVSYPTLQPYLGNCGSWLNGYPSNVGVDELSSDAPLTIAPNPVDGAFTVQVPGPDGLATVIITDAVGRVVHGEARSISSGTLALDASSLAPGAYVIQVRINDQLYTARSVVKH